MQPENKLRHTGYAEVDTATRVKLNYDTLSGRVFWLFIEQRKKNEAEA